jgi:hypothetical protein
VPFAYESPHNKVFHLRYWDPRVSNASAPWHSNAVYPCANIAFSSYTKAAEQFGYDLDGFEIVHQTDPHSIPIIPDDLMYVVDFQIYAQSRVLFRANSSFSFLAGAMGYGKIYSPLMAGVAGSWQGNSLYSTEVLPFNIRASINPPISRARRPLLNAVFSPRTFMIEDTTEAKIEATCVGSVTCVHRLVKSFLSRESFRECGIL